MRPEAFSLQQPRGRSRGAVRHPPPAGSAVCRPSRLPRGVEAMSLTAADVAAADALCRRAAALFSSYPEQERHDAHWVLSQRHKDVFLAAQPAEPPPPPGAAVTGVDALMGLPVQFDDTATEIRLEPAWPSAVSFTAMRP